MKQLKEAFPIFGASLLSRMLVGEKTSAEGRHLDGERFGREGREIVDL